MKLILLILSLLLPVPARPQVVATNTAIFRDSYGPYLRVQWLGIQPAKSYSLECSSDAVHWFALAPVTNNCATNAAWVQQTPITATKMFFRIREP